ncbi:MAG: hypothetical protein PHI67_03560 [Candidatus Methanomethylophilaceae archaeon]|nr:hypothetical protein [Candidatus Methanomethylophilaceae archaeon]
MAHDERCRKCKDTIQAMLEKIYGSVTPGYRIALGTLPEDYVDTPLYPALADIYRALRQYRGFEKFVRADYVEADFFIPDPGFVVEFDESQHFTKPRLIALEHYPAAMQAGYSVPRWKELCAALDRRDNDPPYRDEQRAWYDTLRDFLPEIKGYLPTVRLYAREMVWCSLDPEEPGDVERFRKFLEEKRMCSTLPEPRDSPIEHRGADQMAAASREVPAAKEPGVTSRTAAPQGLCKVEEQEMSDAVARRTRSAARSVPESLLRFEYLTNAVKLRYLEDCFTHPVNAEVRFFSRYSKPVEQVRLTSGDGKPFAAYINRLAYIRGEGSALIGPLFSSITPDTISECQEITVVNTHLYGREMQTDDWLRLFCEYMLIKTVIHELITDTEEHEEDWGYKDFKAILNAAGAEGPLKCSRLRDLIVNALRLGLDPSSISSTGEPEEKSFVHLSALPYRAFMARREEWIGAASSALAGIRSRATLKSIHTVMQWDRYSMCAFESGPVFIRKDPDWLLPRVTSALASYSGWNDGLPADRMMTEILSPYLHILIGSYWHHFQNGCEVRFFEQHHELAKTIPPLRRELDEYWAGLRERVKIDPGTLVEPGTGEDSSKVDVKPSYSRKARAGSTGMQTHPEVSLEEHKMRAQEIGVGQYFIPLTDAFDRMFPACWPMGSSVNYRVRDTCGYPEADAFNLYIRGSGKSRGLKFRVYYNVFADFLGRSATKEDVLKMLPGIVKDNAREGHVDDRAEWYVEGYFTSKQEVDHLLTSVKTWKQAE